MLTPDRLEEKKGEVSPPPPECLTENSDQPSRPANYAFPTDSEGDFAKAMKSIASNAGAKAKGIFSNFSEGDEAFRDVFAQALALKLNLTTAQRANEKTLKDLTVNNGSSASLKQAIQARAALYGELLEPS